VLTQTSATTLAEEPPLTPEELAEQPPPQRGRRARAVAVGLLLLLLALVLFLALTAPLSKSLKPITAPSITLLSAEGRPIARKGSVTDLPVRVETLPRHVPGAFLAIEDRRFYEHLGVDPWGIARALGKNVFSGGVVEGGSTISQQLAKLAFLSSERTAARKVQEAILAVWLETWLSKDDILSRYMSSVYFGDNVYGLRAAANHYFSRKPEELTVEQAAMLAGLVKAPSTLAPLQSQGRAERGPGGGESHGRCRLHQPARAAEKLPKVESQRGRVKDVPSGSYLAIGCCSELGQSSRATASSGSRRRWKTASSARPRRRSAAASIGGAQVALVR
jgi:penicillin-binding protein 1A